jgi:hypothetical protein
MKWASISSLHLRIKNSKNVYMLEYRNIKCHLMFNEHYGWRVSTFSWLLSVLFKFTVHTSWCFYTVSFYKYIFFYFLWLCSPSRAMASSFTRFLDHTQRRATVGRTPLDEWSARRRDLYLTTHNIYKNKNPRPRWDSYTLSQ